MISGNTGQRLFSWFPHAPAPKISLLAALLAFPAPGAAIAFSVPARAQESAERKDVVALEKMEAQAGRYQWRHAQIDDFEILSGLDDDKLAAQIIQNALQTIDVFRTRSPLFRIERELPTRRITLRTCASRSARFLPPMSRHQSMPAAV